MKRTKTISKKRLFIKDLELPAPAVLGNKVTTMAIGEEALKK
jgi:hypothetical protein